MSTHVSAGGYDWHYRLLGSAADPPLLLLHGFTGCAAVWDEVAEALKDRFRVLAVDLPGHGRTVTAQGIAPFRMETVADGLRNLLGTLDIARTHLWGYSMGGRLALHLAALHPGMVERVILESASPGIADPHDRALRRAADDELANRIERDGVAAFIDSWMAQPLFQTQARLPEARQARARALRLANSAAGLANSLRGMGTGAQAPLHGALHSLRSPVLLLTGEHDSKFCGIAAGMQELLPDATMRIMRIMPDIGHAPHWEAPESCIQLVEPFLRGLSVPESVPYADRQHS